MAAHEENGRSGSLDLALKRFAPGDGVVHLPVSSKQAALAGIAFYAACRRDAARAQKVAWIATTLLGPGVLRGRVAPWAPPMERDVWEQLAARWRLVVGDFDTVTVAHLVGSTDGVRLLLLAGGQPRGVAKIHPAATGLCEREASALGLLARAHPRSFRVSRLLDVGEVRRWSYVLLTPLPPRIHHVHPEPPLARIVGEIAVGLSGMPRPASVPRHWQPMHGELAPWTLRRTSEHDLVILDWETASWGPPGADEVFYRASASALEGGHPGPIHVREAVDFWRRKALGNLVTSQLGPDFTKEILRALDEMTPSPHA